MPEILRDDSLNRLLPIFRKICDSIAFAHSQGVVHRDLRPENIMALPHIRGNRVHSALSSVAMKALRLAKGDRYTSVIALSADIDAHLTGFARPPNTREQTDSSASPAAAQVVTASPDRCLIAVGGTYRFIMILDADTLAVKHRFRAHDLSSNPAPPRHRLL